jgi:hypothetical protein
MVMHRAQLSLVLTAVRKNNGSGCGADTIAGRVKGIADTAVCLLVSLTTSGGAAVNVCPLTVGGRCVVVLTVRATLLVVVWLRL